MRRCERGEGLSDSGGGGELVVQDDDSSIAVIVGPTLLTNILVGRVDPKALDKRAVELGIS